MVLIFMAKKRTSTPKAKPKKRTSTKQKKGAKKIDRSVLWAGVIGIILAIGLIVYYTFFDY